MNKENMTEIIRINKNIARSELLMFMFGVCLGMNVPMFRDVIKVAITGKK